MQTHIRQITKHKIPVVATKNMFPNLPVWQTIVAILVLDRLPPVGWWVVLWIFIISWITLRWILILGARTMMEQIDIFDKIPSKIKGDQWSVNEAKEALKKYDDMINKYRRS